MGETVHVTQVDAAIRAGEGDDTFVLQAIASGVPRVVLDGGAGYDVLDARQVFTGYSFMGIYDTSFTYYFDNPYAEDGFTLGSFDAFGFEKILGSTLGANHFLLQKVDWGMEVHGGAFADRFVGSFDYADIFHGYGGNDTIDVRPLDVAYGGEGDDTFKLHARSGSLAGSLADGGAGRDRLELDFGWTVDLMLGTADGVYSGNADTYEVRSIEDVEIDAWKGYETSVLGDGADNAFSVDSDWDDGSVGVVFDGRAGDDVLSGSIAGDLIKGGTGADLIEGRAGDDTLSGGEGDDVFIEGAGSDAISGGAGFDEVRYDGDIGSYGLTLTAAGSVLVESGEDLDVIGADIESLTFAGNGSAYLVDAEDTARWDRRLTLGDGDARTTTVLMDNGVFQTFDMVGRTVVSHVAEDAGDTFAWSHREITRDTDGVLQRFEIDYDDGRSLVRDYDAEGHVALKTITGSDGRLTTVSYEVGLRSLLRIEDRGDEKDWEWRELVFDAEGQKSQLTIHYDDGHEVVLDYGSDLSM